MILDNFEGKLHVAVVGATGGLGKAISECLLQHSAVESLYALSRSQTTQQHKKLIALNIDFNDELTLELAASKIVKPLDLIINATGFLHLSDNQSLQPEKTYRHITVDNFLQNYRVNTLGPALVAKHFLPLLNTQRKSVFAALSARVGSISDNRLGGWYAYRASKAALNMLIKSLAIETARKHKQAIIIGLHPGTVDTGLSKPFQLNVPAEQLFTAEQSVQYLFNVINGLSTKDSGKCFAWDGKEIPA